MSFPRYERYKDSGVEWLGEVPEHWQVKRLRFALKLVTDRAEETENVIALENLESWTGRLLQTDSEFEGDGVAFRKGDILFGKLRPYLAKAYLAENSGAAVGDFHVLRPCDGLAGELGLFFFLSPAFIDMLDGSTIGAKMPRVSWSFLADMFVPIAPHQEQMDVSAFLTRETAKIDALIEEQQRLIEFLKEKRQAVISHAATKGLNPNAPMKDSGVEWLGRIPAHWNVIPMGYLVKLFSGGTPDKTNECFWDGTVPWVSPKDMKVGEIVESQDHVTDEAVLQSGLRLFAPGHLLIVVRGMILAHTFPVATNIVPVTINQDMKAVLCGERITSAFLHQFLNGLNDLIVSQADESAHGTLKLESSVLSNLPIPVPPVDEQLSISNWVGSQMTTLNLLIGQVDAAIQHLQERRSALISAAVTGKIDVRNYAAKETHEPA